MRRILRTPTLWILLVAGALLLAISLANQAPPPDELTFSEFQSVTHSSRESAILNAMWEAAREECAYLRLAAKKGG